MADAQPDILAIFTEAVACETPQQREEFLADACGDDSVARQRVETLLRAHLDAGNFLGGDAKEFGATLDQPITEKPGTEIGPYKLLQQVGEGGMGVVYMAEQKEPVKRRVALKIIKPGMDTRQVIARFEAERQALAMMDHPNIAKVLDAGQTESGRPYFVMELVKGMPVTSYCDEQHLTPKERLELFVPICQAVQHAHQKGIIHRDLKPSNILVALYDGRAVPKIIDFGVAKATSHTLTEKTMFTQVGQVVGTLEYMAPEQAQVNQLDVDTRSDIYSLGVVLYELLTGETPFDRARLRSAAFDEILRIIREEEPSKPSTKVSSSQSLPSIAANRRIEPAKLGSTIRGELDWIVLKAMEKDRGRRYETASKFAEDVQHYLNDEAVVACPPSRAYRFRKFARRNRPILATACIVGVSLLIGISTTAWQAVRATQAERAALGERDGANVARHLAEERFELAKEAVEQYLNHVTENEKLKQADFHDLRRDLLEAAIPFYQRLSQEKPGDQAQTSAQGSAFNRLGQIQGLLEEHAASQASFERALRIFESLAEELPRVPKYLADVVYTHIRLGDVSARIGQHEKAKSHYQRALHLSQQLVNEFSRKAEHQYLLAGSHSNLAHVLTALGEYSEAETHYRTAVNLHEQLARDFPDGPCHRDFVVSSRNLGLLLRKLGKLKDARECLTASLESSERLLTARTGGPDYRAQVASSHHEMGNLLQVMGDLGAAKEHYESSLLLNTHLADQFPDVTSYLASIAYNHNVLAIVEIKLGRKEVARSHFEQTIKLLDPISDQVPERRSFLATAHYNLALLLCEVDDSESARAHFQKAIDLQEQLVNEFAHVPSYREKLAETYTSLGVLLRSEGKLKEAISGYQRAIEIHPEHLKSHHNLGLALTAQGKLHEAVASQRRAAELDPADANRLTNLAWTLATSPDAELRDAEAAAAYARKAIKLQPARANHWCNLGAALYRAGEWSESVEALTNVPGGIGDLYHRFFLAMAYWQLNDEENARSCYREALAYWYEKKREDRQLMRFRDEAEELLGITVKERESLLKSSKQILVDYYTQIVEHDSEYWEAYLKRGDLFRDTQQLQKAIDNYTAFLQARPKDAFVWNKRSVCHCHLKNWQQALDDSNQAIERDPKAWMYSHRAWPLIKLGRYEEAVSDCNRALEQDPNNATAMHRRASAHKLLGQMDLAVADAVAAVIMESSSQWTWKCLRGCALTAREQEHLAPLDELHQYFKKNANSLSSRAESLAEIYLIRAQLFTNQGDAEKATADLETASEIAPESPLPFQQLGKLRVATGNWKEAAIAYSRALELDPKNATAIQWLGICLQSSGDKDAYRQHCHEMLKRHAATEDPAVAGAVARCFTYQEWPQADLKTALALARLAANESKSDAWDQYCYGALLFRAGRCEEARKRLAGALTRKADKPPGNVLFYLAMTHHALGDAEQADDFFQQGERWLAEQQSPKPIPKQLREEAKQVLSGARAESDEPAVSANKH